jgi:hypothetical protein
LAATLCENNLDGGILCGFFPNDLGRFIYGREKNLFYTFPIYLIAW